ncbi:MAG: hypothetical protein U1D96_05400 [Eubacteriales bacterium]|nr:hypothetical protein [Clostridia bacterium]MDZ4042916.1 hypothetical protein [Eubacteriales bacterium]
MSKKVQLPEIIKQHVFLKKATLEGLAAFIHVTNDSGEEEPKPGNRALLFTAFGVVEGDIVNVHEEPPKDEPIALNLGYYVYQARNKLLEMQSEKHASAELAEASSFVVLRDARVFFGDLSGTPTPVNELFLFTDQIIGFSIGHIGSED